LIAGAGRDFTGLWHDAGSGDLVTCPKLPPKLADGETLPDDARANAAEEIAALARRPARLSIPTPMHGPRP